MYLFCLFMRVLLSWFPSIDWNAQPWTFLRLVSKMAVTWRGRWQVVGACASNSYDAQYQSLPSLSPSPRNPCCLLLLLQITEPYLQIYRGILPPLFGQLDFTPLFGFLILQDVVEVMAPTYTMGMHAGDTSTRWTTSDVMCYFDGF